MIHLDYRDARPIYTQICDGFRDLIRREILGKGEKLPSVRELATQLTINPNTIQRAYRELEMQGWVASVPGKGCFVCGVPFGQPDPTQALLQEFDNISHQLLELGIDPAFLQSRLEQGGK